MKSAHLHPLEDKRLEALFALDILDTLPESEFDEITMLASQVCGTPIALISLVDKNRQWFKSKQGLGASETPRDFAFCAHAILDDKPFCIPDSKQDERFFDNPLVTGGPKVGFYAGVPILDPVENLPIGTLCVIDSQPRTLSSTQLECLKALKNQVQRLLELRIELKKIRTVDDSLKAITDRQEFILEGAGLGAWDWWLESGKVIFDRRWCEMLGLDFKSVTHDISTWESLVHPDDKAKTYSDIKLYLDGKASVYENIHRLRHTNGDWVWILDRGRISQRDSSNKPIRFTGTHFDISSYKRNEIILGEIQRIANIGGWEYDLESGTTRWTDQIYKIHEISSSIPACNISEIEYYAPNERERIIDNIERCKAGQTFREVFDFIDSKGTSKWVEITGVPISNADGKVRFLMGTFQDVTEKINYQKQLEEAQRIAKIGSWNFDLRTGEQTWSSEHYRIFEIAEPQPAEKLYQMYRDRIHPEDLPELDSVVGNALKTGAGFIYNHRVLLKGEQQVKYVQGIGRVTLGAGGRPIAIQGTCQDITDRVVAEKELEISRLKAVHASKLASLGEMSAGIAHEINNPLTIIGGHLSLLESLRGNDRKFSERVDIINRAVERIAKIVKGLRKFSRSSDSKEMKISKISDLLQEALVLVEPKSKRNSIGIVVEALSESPILCDSIEIEQVFVNLINNAIDAARATDERWVKIRVFDKGPEVIFQVEDSGLGLSTEVEAKIFQPFFTTKPVGEGTGLGLSISKGILDSHGARLELNRNFKHTCFEVRFKRAVVENDNAA